MILGNPLHPILCRGVARDPLERQHPTFANKVEAVATSGRNLKFLTDTKATIQHPEMTTYKKLMMRERAVKGFHEWDLIHMMVVEQVVAIRLGPRTSGTCSGGRASGVGLGVAGSAVHGQHAPTKPPHREVVGDASESNSS